VFDLKRIAESGLVEQVDFHEELGSTNDRALEIGASGDVRLPLLVLTKRQTAGRGRGSNRWVTSEGALTFSLLVEVTGEQLPLQHRPQIALVAGVAVSDALSQFVPRELIQLKWPNDVYLGGRKAGGILSESVPGWPDRFVVGVGINVNNRVQESEAGRREHQAEPGVAATATSIVEASGSERDLTSVLLSVLDEFERRWSELVACGFAPAATVYRERCFLSGKTIEVEQRDGSRVSGLSRGIDEYGRLLIWTPSGLKSLISGSVVGWND
jgi:BirA family biotin operon repressor/biotin-[acetyl-CoA-carboxylase] ligase